MLVFLCIALAIVCGSLLVCLFFNGSHPHPNRFEVRDHHQEQLIKQLEVQLLASILRTEEAFRAGFRAFRGGPRDPWTFDSGDTNAQSREQAAWEAFCAKRGRPSC